MTTFIYTLTDPLTKLVRYVGKTDYPDYRLKRHCDLDLNKKYGTKKEHWIKSLLKNDIRPILEIIDEVEYEKWQFWEMYWISQFRSWGFDLTNSDEGGYGGSKGREIKDSTRLKLSESGKKGVEWKHTEETLEIIRNISTGRPKTEEEKQKLSDSNKGKNLGKKHTEETKLKISESNKGRVKTPEEIEKLSIANKGQIRSEETRQKISESKKGKTFKIKNPRSEEYREKQRKPKGPLSEEAKKKIGEKSTGRIKSDEEREKLSISNKGQTRSDDAKLNMSNAAKGKKRAPFSEETKLKMSEAAKNRKNKQ